MHKVKKKMIKKIRIQVNSKNRKKQNKINKTKGDSFESVNKIHKLLTRLVNKNRGETNYQYEG